MPFLILPDKDLGQKELIERAGWTAERSVALDDTFYARRGQETPAEREK